MWRNMSSSRLQDRFNSYLEEEHIFENKRALTIKYFPSKIPHREEYINKIADILAPALRVENPSNLFVYGKTGTGKTLSVKYVMENMEEVAEKEGVSLKCLYINCNMRKVADTEYRLVAHLASQFGEDVPSTGLPTDEVYRIFYDTIDDEERVILLILDEIDKLIQKSGDSILYNLTRINNELERSELSLIGISNNLTFTENLDSRVKSSLGEEEILFPPYDAKQLKDILKERGKDAFYEDALGGGVISKCAAYAAREHGDARRALNLLRVAGEIAERKNASKVGEEHVDMAERKIERDKILMGVRKQPTQSKLVLYSIIDLLRSKEPSVQTGDVYSIYKKISNQSGYRQLTQRRVSDLISELDMLGVINAKVISKGRYGRTREISLGMSDPIKQRVVNLLENELKI